MTACEHDALDFVSITLAPHEHSDTACPDCQRVVRVFGTIYAPGTITESVRSQRGAA